MCMARRRLKLADIPDRLTAEEFWALFGDVEHEGLDFKRGINDSLYEVIPAMAMTNGGILVHGVDDERRILGCPLIQRVQDRITRYAKECSVEVEVRAVGVGGRELTLVAVPEVGERIVTTPDGRLLRRVGGDSQPLRGEAMALFVRDHIRVSAEQEPLRRGFDPDDFDLDAVNSALVRQGREPVARESLGRALCDLHVAERDTSHRHGGDGELIVVAAAALLFAHDPRRFVAGAEVQLVRRVGIGPGPGPTSDRESCCGPFEKTVECCTGFIERHTRQFEVVTGVRRELVPEYPAAAVREAVVNALAHRDYALAGATIDITVWDDRIEFRSPGPLPGHITAANMRTEHFSRNRLMMRNLKEMGLVEEFGDGIDRMYREMEARLMPPPEFETAAASLTVTLRNRQFADFEDRAWLQSLGAGPDSTEERLALVQTRRAGRVARREFAEALPHADIDRLLRTLVAKGLLERVGRGGGTQYRLSAEVVARAGDSSFEVQRRRRQSLLDEMHRRGSLSAAEATRVLDGDVKEARRILRALSDAGLVQATGNTKARRYRAAPSSPISTR